MINRSNIKTVGELQELSDAELMDIRDFGQKSLDEVKIALSKIKLIPKFKQPELEISLEEVPDWFRIPALQISTNDLLLSIRTISSLSLRQSIRNLGDLYPTIAHLIFAFESKQISLTLKQISELHEIINPFSMLRNAPQAYLDWLSCFAYSTQ